MANLQELFAKLQTSTDTDEKEPEQTGMHIRRNVSSPFKSPPQLTSQIGHESVRASSSSTRPNTSKLDSLSTDRTASLLNLLRFNQPNQTASALDNDNLIPLSSVEVEKQSQSFTALSSSSGNIDQLNEKAPMESSIPISSPEARNARSNPKTSIENPQDFLLKLLNTTPARAVSRITPFTTKTTTEDMPAHKDDLNPAGGLQEKESTPIKIFGSNEDGRNTPFEPPSMTNTGSMFTYVNPFEQLSASSPKNRSPKPRNDRDKGKACTPKMEILKSKWEEKG